MTVGTIDGLLLSQHPLRSIPGADNLGLRLPGVYDVRDFGAVADGLVNDGPAVRAAIARASKDLANNPLLAHFGITIYLPAGRYMTDVTGNPEDESYLAAIHLPSGFRLQGDGMDASILQFLPGMPQGAAMILNRGVASGNDTGIRIESLTLHGNAAMQHGIQSHFGLSLLRARGVQCTDVRAQDFYGSSHSGIGENVHIVATLSEGCSFTRCEAIATNPNTASGFGLNSSQSITYTDCIARGMGITCGFTNNRGHDVRHVGCISQANAYHGFNSEGSTDVSYVNCLAGGQNGGFDLYPYAAGAMLGNGYDGFVCNYSTGVIYISCDASFNSICGLEVIWTGSGTVAQVQGGIWRRNGRFGINPTPAGSLSITGQPVFDGNGAGDIGSVAHAQA